MPCILHIFFGHLRFQGSRKEHRHEIGFGYLYQGRYKSFPVETDDYFYQVVRYAERNALRANLVARAELWPWSSLAVTGRATPLAGRIQVWPLPRPVDWLELVNHCETEAELAAIRHCVSRGCPYGSPAGAHRMARVLSRLASGRACGKPHSCRPGVRETRGKLMRRRIRGPNKWPGRTGRNLWSVAMSWPGRLAFSASASTARHRSSTATHCRRPPIDCRRKHRRSARGEAPSRFHRPPAATSGRPPCTKCRRSWRC